MVLVEFSPLWQFIFKKLNGFLSVANENFEVQFLMLANVDD